MMFLKTTINILTHLLDEANIDKAIIAEASDVIHLEERNKSEYDILVKGTLRHGQLQQIDDILSRYDNVEMMMDSEGLLIFETEKEEEAKR